MSEVHPARITNVSDSMSSSSGVNRRSDEEINGPGAELRMNIDTLSDLKSKAIKPSVTEACDARNTIEHDGNVLMNGCITVKYQDENESCVRNEEDEKSRSKEDISLGTNHRLHEHDVGHLGDTICNKSKQDDGSGDTEKRTQLSEEHEHCSVSEDLSKLNIKDSSKSEDAGNDVQPEISYVGYESEGQMPDIMRLITKDLSEPYSIYTYRYFIHNWPHLCFLAMHGEICVGAIVCKLDVHKKMAKRGYIAMLAVDENYRRQKIGSKLVRKAIYAMVEGNCDEVVLETEITNKAALQLYENLGFVRDKRLFRYYLNGVDALRLKLWLR
ncbi:uncharacterized protein LOC144453812 [Glandiceps talaboti]